MRFHENLRRIGDGCFYSCKSLLKLKIPDSVSVIGKGAFGACSRLTTCELPVELLHLPENVFDDCISLSRLKLPPELESIGMFAFRNCRSLKKIDACDISKVAHVGYGAFENCSSLASITLPPACQIPDVCFQGCSSLKSVTLPRNAYYIERRAFNNCHRELVIEIPKNLRYCGAGSKTDGALGRSCYLADPRPLTMHHQDVEGLFHGVETVFLPHDFDVRILHNYLEKLPINKISENLTFTFLLAPRSAGPEPKYADCVPSSFRSGRDRGSLCCHSLTRRSIIDDYRDSRDSCKVKKIVERKYRESLEYYAKVIELTPLPPSVLSFVLPFVCGDIRPLPLSHMVCGVSALVGERKKTIEVYDVDEGVVDVKEDDLGKRRRAGAEAAVEQDQGEAKRSKGEQATQVVAAAAAAEANRGGQNRGDEIIESPNPRVVPPSRMRIIADNNSIHMSKLATVKLERATLSRSLAAAVDDFEDAQDTIQLSAVHAEGLGEEVRMLKEENRRLRGELERIRKGKGRRR